MMRPLKTLLQMRQEGLEPRPNHLLEHPAAHVLAQQLWDGSRRSMPKLSKLDLSLICSVGQCTRQHVCKECGSIEDARQVFDKMVKRDLISWTMMIGAYADSGHGEEAFETFLQMRQEGLEPDAITYMSILNPCASPWSVGMGQEGSHSSC